MTTRPRLAARPSIAALALLAALFTASASAQEAQSPDHLTLSQPWQSGPTLVPAHERRQLRIAQLEAEVLDLRDQLDAPMPRNARNLFVTSTASFGGALLLGIASITLAVPKYGDVGANGQLARRTRRLSLATAALAPTLVVAGLVMLVRAIRVRRAFLGTLPEDYRAARQELREARRAPTGW